jgi:hypothetical protein
MRFAVETCRQVFAPARLTTHRTVVVRGKEPEFAIANGLALAGRIDLRVQRFSAEVRDLIDSGAVHAEVEGEIDSLIRAIARVIAAEMPDRFIMPAFNAWQDGRLDTLRLVTEQIETELQRWLNSGAANAVILEALSEWFRELSPRIQTLTEPICIRYQIPSSSFKLDGVTLSSARLSMGAPLEQLYDDLADILNLALSTIITAVVTAASAAITLGIGAVLVWVLSFVAGDLARSMFKDTFFDARVPLLLRKTLPAGAVRHQMVSKTGQIESELVKGFTQAPEARQELIDSVVAPVKLELQHDADRVALMIR